MLKKGDNVMVIAGKDRGKQGIIEKVFPKREKAVVTGINLAKHHLKPTRKNPHGGIMDIPAPITLSNLGLVCPHCGKTTRIGYKIDEKSQVKERICRKCKGNLEITSVKENPSTKLRVKEKNVKA